MSLPARLQVLASLSFGLCLALVAGCSSDPQAERAAHMPETVPDYPPLMTGTETFGSGKILVTVNLGMPPRFRPDAEGGGRRSGAGGHGGRHGGGHRGGGLSAGGMGGYGGQMEGGAESPSSEQTSGEESAPRARVTGSNLPPAQLKLVLENTSADALRCEVVDFNSSLGNFAVFPSTYSLAPGKTMTSETMTSRMGVEGETIPVTVALRVNNQVERKVVTLHLIPPPPKPAAEPAK